MIPRLDVAVDRKRRARPVWRADLCAQHAAHESVTGIRGTNTDTGGAVRPSRSRNRCPTSYAPKIASLGWEHIGFSGGYVWPSEPLKQKVSALRSCAPHSSIPLTVRFRTDSAMTPTDSVKSATAPMRTSATAPAV